MSGLSPRCSRPADRPRPALAIRRPKANSKAIVITGHCPPTSSASRSDASGPDKPDTQRRAGHHAIRPPTAACTACVRARRIARRFAPGASSTPSCGIAKAPTHAEPGRPLPHIAHMSGSTRTRRRRCTRTGPRREPSSLRVLRRLHRSERSGTNRPDRTIARSAVPICTLPSPRGPSASSLIPRVTASRSSGSGRSARANRAWRRRGSRASTAKGANVPAAAVSVGG
jgi:hypothetical protein